MNNIYNLIMIVILAASLVWPNLKWKCGNYKHFPFTDENVQENLNECKAAKLSVYRSMGSIDEFF